MRSLGWLLLAAAAAACGRATEPLDQTDTFPRVEAGDTIRLQYGEGIEVGDDGARIVFRSVAGDSRCPIDVTCVWAGDAHVRLEASLPSGNPRPLELHTTLEPKEAEFAGFRILLIDVAPDRRDGDGLRPEDYSVLLAISRG